MKKTRLNKGWTFYNDIHNTGEIVVTLPHDAMLTEQRSAGTKNAAATGFYPGGRYVYKKNLGWDPAWEGKCLLLEFEGIYQNSSVYLNDERIGGHHYGYTGFYVDLMDRLIPDGTNEIRVVADNSQTPNSRWYSGSGIYRDVNLWTGEKEHIKPDGICVTTESLNPAVLAIQTDLSQAAEDAIADTDMVLRITVMECGAADGAQKVMATVHGAECRMTVPDAKLWDEEAPNLYEVRAELVTSDGCIADVYTIRTGIRLLRWSAADGLTVNGKRVLLRGGCIHHDNGILGAAAYDYAERRKVQILKQAGFNAIRSAHNPCSKSLLAACDELGMYVMDEAFDQWKIPNNPYDYAMRFADECLDDLEAMVRKDRSHPSIVMYSVGNEIADSGKPDGVVISKALTEHCHDLDDSRPVLSALNPVVSNMGGNGASVGKPDDVIDPYAETDAKELAAGSRLANIIATVAPIISKIMGKPDKVEKLLKPIMDTMDIVGLNYADNCYEPMRLSSPDRILVGSETHPQDVGDRWPYIEAHPHVVGDFMWTAFDYLGEAGIGVPIYGTKRGGFNRPYPAVSGGCGVIDLLGHPEAESYLTQIAWHQTDRPYIGVLPVDHTGEKRFFGMWRGTDAEDSYSFKGMEGRKADIEVYGSGAEAELLVNGKSLGRKPFEHLKATFHTVYEPGELRAVNYDAAGKILGERTLQSAVGETILKAVAEQTELAADGESMTYIDVLLTDASGTARRMLEDRELQVSVEGPARLLALGSADPMNEQRYDARAHRTWKGRLGLYVQSTGESGKAVVTISTEGIQSASAEVTFM